MNGYLLDTHVWVEVQTDATGRSDPKLRSVLEKSQERGEVYVSAISILELARLVAMGQHTLPCSMDDFVAEAFGDDGLRLVDLTPRILIESTRLPGDLHRDLGDRILAATARELGFTLLTRDKLLLQYAKQGHVNALKF